MSFQLLAELKAAVNKIEALFHHAAANAPAAASVADVVETALGHPEMVAATNAAAAAIVTLNAVANNPTSGNIAAAAQAGADLAKATGHDSAAASITKAGETAGAVLEIGEERNG